ncbi:MAG: helix-turn-helix domain-containing protein [Candidatus Nanopelagicaceae bacterium]
MTTPLEISQRLRQIRKQQNLTLKQVEIRSRGKWKAVVIGSYERGTRSLSISKAKSLCEFYGVPLSALFQSEGIQQVPPTEGALRIDLRNLRSKISQNDPLIGQLHNLLSFIARRRDDWNGEIMTIRLQDNEVLGLLVQKEQSELRRALEIRDLLFKAQGQA